MVDLCALYRLDLKECGYKVACLDRKALTVLALFFLLRFRASRALIQAMYLKT
jgi:hypothetical protein